MRKAVAGPDFGAKKSIDHGEVSLHGHLLDEARSKDGLPKPAMETANRRAKKAA